MWFQGLQKVGRRAEEEADFSGRLALRRLPSAPPVALVCVYRRRNTRVVEELLAGLPPGSRVALWGLDGTAESLRAQTCGSGPGTRFTLLNRCVAALELAPDTWLIAADDDVAMRRGDVSQAVRLAAAAGLAISQPAHCRSSYWTWPYTEGRLGSVVRLGRFVEIGPMVILSPHGRSRVLPFDESPGMGWGIEADWGALADDETRLGIIDGVLMKHLQPMGGSYDTDAEEARLQASLLRHGFTSLEELQHPLGNWRLLGPLPAWRPPVWPAGRTERGPSTAGSRVELSAAHQRHDVQ